MPNRVVAHNWTCASLAFAEAIEHLQAIEAALANAEANGALHKAMEAARTERSLVDGFGFNLRSISEQPREAFHTALGERLLFLDALGAPERAEGSRTRINRCFLVGPSGFGAGVFIAALQNDVSVVRWSDGYRAHMRADFAISYATSPLLERTVIESKAISRQNGS